MPMTNAEGEAGETDSKIDLTVVNGVLPQPGR